MFKGFINLVEVIRQRRADYKTSGGIFNFSRMIDDAQKERNRLRVNPPPCGSVIRYSQSCVYEEAHGVFLFRAVDVEQEFKATLQEDPHLANTDEGAILNWVQRTDESLTEPTDVPSIWARFQYAANDLVRAGKAEIHCRKCDAAIEPGQITTNDDSGKRGWNFDRVVCPHGHNLLIVGTVHLKFN